MHLIIPVAAQGQAPAWARQADRAAADRKSEPNVDVTRFVVCELVSISRDLSQAWFQYQDKAYGRVYTPRPGFV